LQFITGKWLCFVDYSQRVCYSTLSDEVKVTASRDVPAYPKVRRPPTTRYSIIYRAGSLQFRLLIGAINSELHY